MPQSDRPSMEEEVLFLAAVSSDSGECRQAVVVDPAGRRSTLHGRPHSNFQSAKFLQSWMLQKCWAQMCADKQTTQLLSTDAHHKYADQMSS